MRIDLSGRTALVTGSTQGIGLAIAAGLNEAGAQVVLNGRSEDEVERAVAKLPGSRGRAADLASADGCAALIAAEPSVDILVSSLGVYKPGEFFSTDDAVWDLHWQLNVMASVRLARHYLAAMRAAGWGRFVVLSSESAFDIPVRMIHYGVSKAADVALARGLAKLMAGTGVTVNSVLPGPTLSEGLAAMLSEKDGTGRPVEDLAADFVRAEYPGSIIRRAITPEEIANMVVYLASEQAAATTGAALRVDGGILDTL